MPIFCDLPLVISAQAIMIRGKEHGHDSLAGAAE